MHSEVSLLIALTLADWPWETIIATAGAIVVAVLGFLTHSKAQENIQALSDEADKFNSAIQTLDEHFRIQSSLLERAQEALAKGRRK
jgi:hypothetical protein